MAEIIERINKMGRTVYCVDGIEYGNYETAKHMLTWGKRYKRRLHMKTLSKDKLRRHFEDKGYQMVKEAGDTWTIETPDIYVTIVVFPKANASIATYEVTNYFGVYDEFILNNPIAC